MREDLGKLYGSRRRFEGVFDKFGQKSGYKGVLTTILLLDITDVASSKKVTDHLWFTQGKGFDQLKLHHGDVVRFDARVTDYIKGYRGRRDEDDYDVKPVERDFRLSFPNKFVKVKEAPVQELPAKPPLEVCEMKVKRFQQTTL